MAVITGSGGGSYWDLYNEAMKKESTKPASTKKKTVAKVSDQARGITPVNNAYAGMSASEALADLRSKASALGYGQVQPAGTGQVGTSGASTSGSRLNERSRRNTAYDNVKSTLAPRDDFDFSTKLIDMIPKVNPAIGTRPIGTEPIYRPPGERSNVISGDIKGQAIDVPDINLKTTLKDFLPNMEDYAVPDTGSVSGSGNVVTSYDDLLQENLASKDRVAPNVRDNMQTPSYITGRGIDESNVEDYDKNMQLADEISSVPTSGKATTVDTTERERAESVAENIGAQDIGGVVPGGAVLPGAGEVLPGGGMGAEVGGMIPATDSNFLTEYQDAMSSIRGEYDPQIQSIIDQMGNLNYEDIFAQTMGTYDPYRASQEQYQTGLADEARRRATIDAERRGLTYSGLQGAKGMGIDKSKMLAMGNVDAYIAQMANQGAGDMYNRMLGTYQGNLNRLESSQSDRMNQAKDLYNIYSQNEQMQYNRAQDVQDYNLRMAQEQNRQASDIRDYDYRAGNEQYNREADLRDYNFRVQQAEAETGAQGIGADTRAFFINNLYDEAGGPISTAEMSNALDEMYTLYPEAVNDEGLSNYLNQIVTTQRDLEEQQRLTSQQQEYADARKREQDANTKAILDKFSTGGWSSY